MPSHPIDIQNAIALLHGEGYEIKAPRKPPLGLKPGYIWKEERLQEIRDAMGRFNEFHNNSKHCPQEWLDEKHELEKWISDRKYNGKRHDVSFLDEFGKTGKLVFSNKPTPLSGTMVTLEECERRERDAFEWALYELRLTMKYPTYEDYQQSLK